MPAKKAVKRPAAKPPPAWHALMRGRAAKHPIVTLSSVAVLVGILVSLGPAALWAVNYYLPRSEAKDNDVAIRALVADAQHKADRNLAWASVASIKTEIAVSRNRTNDCDIREEKREQMSALERSTCADYRAALIDANKRYDDAHRIAMDLSK